MGVVYKGHDTRLDREVALKFLPAALIDDRERLSRFEREARLLASLHHSNIATVYGLEEADGFQFISMELVPGRNLADSLSSGPLPLPRTLDVFVDIAAGLEAAHDSGVVHRDLKPANIMLTPEGGAKVLDFGLAKSFDSAVGAVTAGGDSTIARDSTEPGVILGTVPYMSPEQARGEPLGKQSDIWAFGCCLYEALTGRRAFEGRTSADTLSDILGAPPDWQALPPSTPPPVRTLLRRALEKDARQRLRDIGDARIELAECRLESSALVRQGASVETGGRQRRSWLVAVVALMAAVVSGAVFWTLGPWSPTTSPETATVRRLTISTSEPLAFARFAPFGVGRQSLALSPDGKRLAYVAHRGGVPRLYIRELDAFDAKPLAGTEGAFQPFFSPDGEWLGFFTEEGLKTTSLRTGSLTIVCEARSPAGATWGPDDTILFTQQSGNELVQVVTRGGVRRPKFVTRRSASMRSSPAWPSLLPDGRTVLFGGRRGNDPIGFISLDPGSSPVLTEIRGTSAHYLAVTGHLVFAREGTLYGVRFDPDRVDVLASPLPLLAGVRHEADSGAAQFAVSRDGTLAYIPGEFLEQGELLWVDRRGSTTPAWPDKRFYGQFALSPDGKRLAITRGGRQSDISIYNFDRDIVTRWTFEGRDYGPIWSSDGRWIAYRSFRDGRYGVFRKRADGSGEEEYLVGPSRPRSIRGQVMVFEESDDIWALRLDTGRKEPVIRSQHNEHFAFLSPDSQRLAYTSTESGRPEVYVCPFPEGKPRVQVSRAGGEEPQWSAKGDELFYRNQNQWMVVDIPKTTPIKPGPPRLLFEGPYLNIPGMSYDYDEVGDRFLVLRGIEDESPVTEIRVVLNWFQEVRERVDGEG